MTSPYFDPVARAAVGVLTLLTFAGCAPNADLIRWRAEITTEVYHLGQRIDDLEDELDGTTKDRADPAPI